MEYLAQRLASVQATQIVRDAEAARERQRRAGLALLSIGAAIAGGGLPVYSAPREPRMTSASALNNVSAFSSGRYKTCRYRVAGEIFPMSVGRAELCSATRSIGGQTGYLVR